MNVKVRVWVNGKEIDLAPKFRDMFVSWAEKTELKRREKLKHDARKG